MKPKLDPHQFKEALKYSRSQEILKEKTEEVSFSVEKNDTLFYNNLFYKNIKAEIWEILRIFKNKPEAEILKRL